MKEVIKKFLREGLLNDSEYIYHGTGKGQALNIQKDGYMKPNKTGEEYPSISFTNSLDYAKYYAKSKGGLDKMVILRTRLNENFKISSRIRNNKGDEYVTFDPILSKDLQILTPNNNWENLINWNVIFNEPILREHFLNTPFKGKNILFHSTRVDSLIIILTTNQIQAKTEQTINTRLNKNINNQYDSETKKYKGVSLSRNQNYNYGDMKLILDGDLIKRDYGKNIIPHDWARVTSNKEIGPKSKPERNNWQDSSESEEFLIGPLKNVKKYVLGIQLLKDTELIINWFIDDEPELWGDFKKTTANIPIYDMNFKPINNIN